MTQHEAIIRTVNELFIFTDERDWDGVKRTLAAEVLLDMSSMGAGEPTVLSGEQVAAGWEEGLRKLQAIHHQVGNYLVDATEDGADVFCYGIASHYYPNPTGQNVRTFVGTYNIHLAKADSGWRIDKFRFNLKYIDGNKDL
ncbi:nuclear transport factor 2 family protein [Paenibacillus roseipurpureus]|uniref:Nuclear transport factor 2 family protein n=1 Tax=Paenibacillus roseopurpureus TaxID=2918901 RepID=A0AA96RN57_9BACL|nr:nuclear transport factor 2 family protein [Paenibacillus sp. MBLB1832]WNR45052.1 nuclear transport factor 2 family protein [Paenibacillus sp. MBLB1832]